LAVYFAISFFFSENKAKVYCKLKTLTVARPAGFQIFLGLEINFVLFLLPSVLILSIF